MLFVGQQPETVDFSDPALPPGFDAAKIHAGIAIGMQQMVDRGWAGRPVPGAARRLGGRDGQERLAAAAYAAVVIGGGLRIPPRACCCSSGW